MRKDKLLFIDSYHDDVYGAQLSMLNLATILDEYDVSIASFCEGKLSKQVSENQLKFVSLNLLTSLLTIKPKNKLYLPLFTLMLAYNWLVNTLNNYRLIIRYDKVCINDLRTIIYILPVLLLCKGKLKLLWYIRIKESDYLVKCFSILFDNVIVISSKMFDSYKSLLNNKLELIINGFDFKNIKLKERNDSIVKFVCLASICERKNQIETLEVVRIFCKNHNINVQLDFIGGITDEEYYLSLLSKINEVESKNLQVNFLGYLNNPISVLTSYDVSILTSHREGLPRTLIESALCGLYLICKEVEGADDIIFNDNIGIVYNDKSLIFQNSTCYLYDKLNMRNKVERASDIKGKFSNDKFVKSFCEVLK